MDKSAAYRPPESAIPSPEVKLPPVTLENLRQILGHKNIDETKEYMRTVKDRKELAERIYAAPGVRAAYQREGRDLLTELDDVSRTLESKESWLGKSWKFIKRHKWKIAAGAVAAGLAVAGWYYWPQITTWAAGASEAARGYVLKWLGLSAPAVPAVPEVPGIGLPGAGAPVPGPEIAPMPTPVVPPVSAPPLGDALGGLK